MTIEEAQAVLGRCAEALDEVERALVEVLDKLPPSPLEDEILEHNGPFDRATEVRSMVECALTDNIRPAFADLWQGATATEEELLARWQRKRN